MLSGFREAWRRRHSPWGWELSDEQCEIDGTFVYSHWADLTRGGQADVPEYGDVAWELTPRASARVALGCVASDADGNERWPRRPGVEELAQRFKASEHEAVRWHWSSSHGCGVGTWWDSDKGNESRRAAAATEGLGAVVYHHALITVPDKAAWSAVMSVSWPGHEHTVTLLALRGHERLAEVAAQMRGPETPRITDILESDELMLGVTVAVDQGDSPALSVASTRPIDPPRNVLPGMPVSAGRRQGTQPPPENA